MSEKNLPSRGGKPLIEINQNDFEQLCYMLCTLNEIAGFFKCSHDTIQRWCVRTYEENFEDVWSIYSSGGKISLRRAQLQAAMKGNPTMLIWLGKQHLDQKDLVEEKPNLPENEDVTYIAEWGTSLPPPKEEKENE